MMSPQWKGQKRVSMDGVVSLAQSENNWQPAPPPANHPSLSQALACSEPLCSHWKRGLKPSAPVFSVTILVNILLVHNPSPF